MTHLKVPSLFIKTFIFVPLFLISNLVNAALILNGNFDNDLEHWHDASDTGSVVFDNEAVNLKAGDGTSVYSAVFVQGDDGFFNFNSPINIESGFSWISFDLWQVSNEVDNTESAIAPFHDYLKLFVYDSIDTSFDLELSGFSVNTTQQAFIFDISSFIGRSVAFSFELVDEQDGFNAAYGLDNIQLRAQPNTVVPEPSGFLLFLIAFTLFVFTQFHRNRSPSI